MALLKPTLQALFATTLAPPTAALHFSKGNIRTLGSACRQQPFAFPVDPEKHFFFISHHKTGTHLMMQICNTIAATVSGGTERCALCLRMRPDGTCPHEGKTEAEKHMRCGNPSRFTIISNMHGIEFHFLLEHFPNFRAVHMVRNPVDMVISSWQYDRILLKPMGEYQRWDMEEKNIGVTSDIRMQLQNEARSMLSYVTEMRAVNHLSATDPRVLTTDLDTFAVDYNGTTAKLLNFLFDDLPQAQLDLLLERAAKHDKSHWTENTRTIWAQTSRHSNKTEALMEWKKLEDARDPGTLRINSYIKGLGYSPDHHRADI